jgi:hypothetical protein
VLSRAALRRRLLDASTGVPIDVLFVGLRLLARFVDVDRLAVKPIAADVHGLAGADLERFCRRAWWGAKASDVLAARMLRHPDEVRARVGAPDWSRLARRVGGAILAGVHVGPVHVAVAYAAERFADLLVLLRGPWRGPGRPRVARLD